MGFGAVFEIIFAALAVFGLLCFVKMIINHFFMPRSITLAARIFDDESRENVAVLIDILKKERVTKDICLLISEEMSKSSELMEALYYCDVMFYIVKD